MFSAAMSCIGYIILATCSQKSVGASYFGLFLVVGGNFSLFPLVMCVPQSIVHSIFVTNLLLALALGAGRRTYYPPRVREVSALRSLSPSRTVCQCEAFISSFPRIF